MLKKIGNFELAIKDMKTDKEQVFPYDKIFDQNVENDEIFTYIYDTGVLRLFDNMNVCVISIGQNRSGKSHTLFGPDSRFDMELSTNFNINADNTGAVIKTFESLYKSAKDLKDTKDFQICCSLIEVHKEVVRDLLCNYQYMKPPDMMSHEESSVHDTDQNKAESRREIEGLEVYENSNGVVMLKNLQSVPVNDLDE